MLVTLFSVFPHVMVTWLPLPLPLGTLIFIFSDPKQCMLHPPHI